MVARIAPGPGKIARHAGKQRKKDKEREREGETEGEGDGDLKGDIFQQRTYLVSDLHRAKRVRLVDAMFVINVKLGVSLKPAFCHFYRRARARARPSSRRCAQVIRKLSLPYISLFVTRPSTNPVNFSNSCTHACTHAHAPVRGGLIGGNTVTQCGTSKRYNKFGSIAAAPTKTNIGNSRIFNVREMSTVVNRAFQHSCLECRSDIFIM